MAPKIVHFTFYAESLLAPFSRPFPKVDFLMHFGRPLAHLWLPLAPLGCLLAPFGSLLAPFGSLLAHFRCPLPHFRCPWAPFSLYTFRRASEDNTRQPDLRSPPSLMAPERNRCLWQLRSAPGLGRPRRVCPGFRFPTFVPHVFF